uniref:CSON013928 protein n=1 Tax=Culicoides sonorensis TaxID=179676 RepID=A0A336KNT5_CULSO
MSTLHGYNNSNMTIITSTAATFYDTTTTIAMTSNEPNKYAYCGKGLDDFHTSYSDIHGYVALVVCIFGCIANSLNIIVLTRHEMRGPTNAILTGLAIADFLVMIDYIPYAYYIVTPFTIEQRFTYGWAWFVMFHALFGQMLHTISIWLTVTLAIWRYIAVAHPQHNRIWSNMRTTMIAITSSYMVCPLLVIPLYFTFQISTTNVQVYANGTLAKINTSFENIITATTTMPIEEITLRNITLYKIRNVPNQETLMQVNFWVYSIIIKLVPCIALTILSLRLIHALMEAKRRRKQLCNSSNLKTIVNGKVVETSTRKNSKLLDKERQTDRTTKMLLAVLLLFLITEFPQGILGLLSAVIGNLFFQNCYQKLGDVMDILALVNSAINFILYCVMSRQFRSTFSLLFRPKILDRWLPVAQNEEDNDRTQMGKDNNGHVTQVTQV